MTQNLISSLNFFFTDLNQHIFSGKIIREKCGTCYGSGKVESLEEILIDVPAGISANERVRVMSHGHEIMVSFEVKEDPKLRRDGLNIHSDLEVSISQAVLGGR